MQVVFHLGAHSTDEDEIIRALAANRIALAARDIVVPHPKRYRLVLRDALVALRGAPADTDTQEAVLAACSDQDQVARMIFSHEFFTCIPARVITPEGFYSMVPDKLAPLANLFPEAETEFHMALINPATLIAALVARQPERSYTEMMHGHDPRDLRWAPIVRRMVEQAEGRKLVIWCNEDLPLIWPEVIRRVGTAPENQALRGDEAILEKIMTPEGYRSLRDYCAAHPPRSIAQRREITSAFLDRYARPDEIEVDIALPGWTEDLIDDISALYDLDVAEIAGMEGVEFIAP